MEYKTTQREIKRLIKTGAAIELTDTKTVPCGRLETGQLYGIPRRDVILFYYY